MKNRSALLVTITLSAVAWLTHATGADAAKPAPAKAPKAAVAEVPPGAEKVSYDDLHKYIGDRIIVHTKFQTTRTGVLAKVTKSELTLNIDTPTGPTQMTIPKDTVADTVAVPAPAPAQH
jgi:hypothetical protein